MRFGDYECREIVLNRFLLDGGAMFGIIPKILWEKKIPADAKNRIPMVCRSLVIRGNGRCILVDAGIGDKLSEKWRRIYDVEDTGTLPDRLAGVGLRPEEVTDVVLSHLHFDHTGGATAFQNGKTVPTFANAVYHIQKEQWDLAFQPSVRDRSSYMPENYLSLESEGRLNLIDGPVGGLFDGIDLIVSHGHTRGQQHLLVNDPAGALFFCGDMIPTAAHLPLSWLMAYDNEPLLLLTEKEEILGRAAEDGWMLCFAHDPVIGAARVRATEKGMVIDQPAVLS